jgi:hypothetical protein
MNLGINGRAQVAIVKQVKEENYNKKAGLIDLTIQTSSY